MSVQYVLSTCMFTEGETREFDAPYAHAMYNTLDEAERAADELTCKLAYKSDLWLHTQEGRASFGMERIAGTTDAHVLRPHKHDARQANAWRASLFACRPSLRLFKPSILAPLPQLLLYPEIALMHVHLSEVGRPANIDRRRAPSHGRTSAVRRVKARHLPDLIPTLDNARLLRRGLRHVLRQHVADL